MSEEEKVYTKMYVCQTCGQHMQTNPAGWDLYIGKPSDPDAHKYLSQQDIEEPRRRFSYCCKRPTFHEQQKTMPIFSAIGTFNQKYLNQIPKKFRLL